MFTNAASKDQQTGLWQSGTSPPPSSTLPSTDSLSLQSFSSRGADDEMEADFSEYMWMEHIEEFDESELKRLEDEHHMRECIAAILADELDESITDMEKAAATNEIVEWNGSVTTVSMTNIDVGQSLLNPLAKEFVPAAGGDSPDTPDQK